MHHPNGTARPLRVLIADDVPATRRSIRLMMNLVPHVKVVAIAHNGRQAIELAHKHNPDIALIDIQMPDLNGLRAIQQILRQNPDITCMILSGQRDAQTLREAMIAGARGYLLKPFTASQLLETMQPIIEQVRTSQARYKQAHRLKQERDTYLTELAHEYLKARRTDDKALEVFESLAASPTCEVRWLRYLAVIYLLRQNWTKLKALADRLERLPAQNGA